MDGRSDKDQVWFVIDTDKWKEQIHELRIECQQHSNWQVAQSNPCFEVWLYYHVKASMPSFDQLDKCKSWKPKVHQLIKGGFNPDFHPAEITIATVNAKNNYEEVGYLPIAGSTQVWKLAEQLISMIGKDLELIKDRFPLPEVDE